MIFKRATNQVQKNTNQYIKSENLEGLRLVFSSFKLLPNVQLPSGSIAFGTALDDTKAPPYVLFFDSTVNQWYCAWYEDYLEATAEWLLDKELTADIYIAILAALGLTVEELCKKLGIRKSTWLKWLNPENEQLMPLSKVQKLATLIADFKY